MIDFNKRGLRLGYLLRGALHDSGGTARTLRLSGPSSRVGSGHVAADPDDSATEAQARRRYWRAGVSGVSLVDDAGKLQQHIGIPGQLSITVPISYPLDPRTETADDTDDATLREWALSGRWANRRVDVWLVDLDTGDTEHRFKGAWDRSPSVTAGAFVVRAKESLGPLDVPWPSVQWPQNTDLWTETRFIGEVDSAYYPGGYQINPAHRGVRVGPVFGDGQVIGSDFEATWRECLPYGLRGVVGGSTDWWAHVSAQEEVYVHEIAVEVLGLATGGILKIAPSFTFFNAEAAAGPLGTNFRFGTSTGVTFAPALAGHRVFARVSGPHAGQPAAVPIGNGAKQEYDDAGVPISRLERILEWHVEDAVSALSLQLPTAFGSTALADFAAARPVSDAQWEQYQCAVPPRLLTTGPSARDVVTDLFRSVPADLVLRFDPTTGERRYFPIWRRPRIAEQPDYRIGPEAFASAAPLEFRQQDDPHGEYSNALTLMVAGLGEPKSLSSGDTTDEIDPKQERKQKRTDQPAIADNEGVQVERDVKIEFWQYTKNTTGDGIQTAARLIGDQFAQPQTWTEAELGARWYKIQLGDTVAYRIHGITDAVGMVRRLEYDLEAQTVTVSAIHVVFYETDGGGD